MGKRRTINKDMEESSLPLGGALLPDPLKFKTAEEKGCLSKETYYSQEQADGVALNIRASGQDKNVYPYACQFCSNYHIGHQYN